jgi:hypothetical protein
MRAEHPKPTNIAVRTVRRRGVRISGFTTAIAQAAPNVNTYV